MKRPNSTIDWALVEKLLQVPASLMDVAIAMGMSDSALRTAINQHRPDLVLKFAQAQAVMRAEHKTMNLLCDRARKIAAVVAAHKAGR